jgi:ribosomal-protein-alanine N-acetyltransferase
VSVAAGAGVVIRDAAARDLPAVLAIEAASFSDPWDLAAFESVLALPHMRFYVAEEPSGKREEGVDGRERERGRGGVAGAARLVGYVVALVAADEAEVADLAVTPVARRRGIGGQLLDQATREAARCGARAMYLEVRESNRRAISIYESRGFREVGRRRGYYQHPREDALLLRCDLAPA